MLKRFVILFIAFGLSLKCWAIHPIKISTCIITKSNGELSINLHFFADDFGAHLNDIYKTVHLDNDAVTDANVLDYIKRHFALKVNSTKLKLSCVGHSLKDNVYQVRFKVSKALDFSGINTTIELSNNLLLEAFDDQTNIVRIDLKGDGNYRTLEFERGRETQKIKI